MRRPGPGGHRDDGRLARLHGGPQGHRRHHRPGRLGGNRADHPRDARSAARRAQADGVHARLGQHGALRRCVRHHDAVSRHRHRRSQPSLLRDSWQCRARIGRDDPAPRTAGPGSQACPGLHHVRRDHALRPAGFRRAGRRVRLPGLSRHRDRRARHGGAGFRRHAVRRGRCDHHRGRRTTCSAASAAQAASASTPSCAPAFPGWVPAAPSTW